MLIVATVHFIWYREVKETSSQHHLKTFIVRTAEISKFVLSLDPMTCIQMANSMTAPPISFGQHCQQAAKMLFEKLVIRVVHISSDNLSLIKGKQVKN